MTRFITRRAVLAASPAVLAASQSCMAREQTIQISKQEQAAAELARLADDAIPFFDDKSYAVVRRSDLARIAGALSGSANT